MIYVIHNGKLLPVPAGGATFQEQQEASSFEAQQQGSSGSGASSQSQSTTPKKQTVTIAGIERDIKPGIYKNPETAETFTLESSGEKRRRVTRYQVFPDGRVLALAGKGVALTDEQYEAIPNAPEWLRTYAFVTPLDSPTTLEAKTITSSDTPEEKRQKTKVIIEETRFQVTDRLRKYRDGGGYDVAAILRDKAATEEELRLIGLSNDAIKAAERTNKRAEEMRKAEAKMQAKTQAEAKQKQASFTKKAQNVLDAIDDEGSIAGALQAGLINRSDLKRYLVKQDGSKFTDKDIDAILETSFKEGVAAVERGRVARANQAQTRLLSKLDSGYRVGQGYDLAKALQDGIVTAKGLEAAFDKQTIKREQQRAKATAKLEEAGFDLRQPVDLVQALNTPGINVGDLEAAGFRSIEVISAIQRQRAEQQAARDIAQASKAAGLLTKSFGRQVLDALKERVTPDFSETPPAAFFTAADIDRIRKLRIEGKNAEADRLVKQITDRKPTLSGGEALATLVDLVPFAEQRKDLTPAERTASAVIDVVFLLPLLPKGVRASVKGGKAVFTKAGKVYKVPPAIARRARANLAELRARGGLMSEAGFVVVPARPKPRPKIALPKKVKPAKERFAAKPSQKPRPNVEKARKIQQRREKMAARRKQPSQPATPRRPSAANQASLTTAAGQAATTPRTRTATQTRTKTGTKVRTAGQTSTRSATQAASQTRTSTRPGTRARANELAKAAPATKPNTAKTTRAGVSPKASARTSPSTATGALPLPSTGALPRTSTTTATSTDRDGGGRGGQDGGRRPTSEGGGRGDDGSVKRNRRPRGSFTLPDGSLLPAGQYPKVATFLMGPFRHTVDFERGTRQIDASVRSGKPEETFQVLEITSKPPKAQTFRQGAFTYRVDRNKVTFNEYERPARWDDPIRPLFRVKG